MQPSPSHPKVPSADRHESRPAQETASSHLQRIRRISRVMALACLALIVMLPVALVYYWATASVPALAAQGNLRASDIQGPLMLWQRLAGTRRRHQTRVDLQRHPEFSRVGLQQLLGQLHQARQRSQGHAATSRYQNTGTKAKKTSFYDG